MTGSSPVTPSPARGRREGFALLITITLLAFLVLLLVSLAALTRVETQVASNNQTLSQARQNALFALNVAIGQLQKYSGPDQRVTARADITTEDDKLTRNGNDEPIVEDIANPLWTGVWDSSKWAPLTGFYDGARRGRGKPAPMTWLVSGNEEQATPLKFTPGDALPAPSATTPKQTLVAGVAADGSADLTTPRVEAPVVAIKSDAVPGIPGEQIVGHYAWWVGDEGVKARLSQVGPEAIAAKVKPATPGAANAALYYWKAMTPTRAGGELTRAGTATRVLPAFDDVFATNATGETRRSNLRQVLLSQQFGLMSGIVPENQLRRISTDFTTLSHGVLADTVRGGLRLDLTRYLETGNTDGAFNAGDSIYADAATAGLVTGGRQPAFSVLKSWYDHGRGLANNGFGATASITPETASGAVLTGMGLFPVVTRYQTAFSMMSNGPGEKLVLVIHPSVTLWNPHNVALAAEDLVLEISLKYDFNRIRIKGDISNWDYLRSGESLTPAYRFGSDYLTAMGLGNPPTLRLRIPGIAFAPGESVVFSLKGNGSVPWTTPAAKPADPASAFPELEPFWNDKNYLSHPTNLTLDAKPLEPGEVLKIAILRGVPGPNRFTAKLYRQSDYASGLALQQVQTPYNGGESTFNHNGEWTLLSTPNPDSSAFKTNYASLRLPHSFSKTPASTTNGTPAVPFAQFNVRGAFGVNTSFERYVETLEGDVQFGIWREDTLVQTPVEPGEDRDHGFGGASMAQIVSGGQDQGSYFILFDYPRRETAVAGNANHPAVVSLGEFQHADLTSNALQPSYTFGNSWPDVRIGRETIGGRWSGFPAPTSYQTPFLANDYLLRDVSYLANHALWDRFFLSTIPQHTTNAPFDSATVLPNPRHRAIPGMIAGTPGYPNLSAVRDTRRAAASMLLEGAFNVNSTSVDAWRALLGGLADVPIPAEGWSQGGTPTGATGDPIGRGLRHNFSRFLLPRGDAFDQTAGGFGAATPAATLSRANWTGHRYLTDAEIDTLARNVVEEVKVRGPFMSLADFVNRRLISASEDESTATNADPTAHRLKVGVLGALQKALLNIQNVTQGVNAAFNQPNMASAPFSYTGGNATVFRNGSAPGSTGSYRQLGAFPSQLEHLNGGLLAHLAFGAPGYVTQADILQKIGPVLAARSDTFVVRAYGDAANPITGAVDGRAWCEAVVQRLPELVDASQPAETAPGALNVINQTFGRRYHVVSFRWLTTADL